MNKRKVYVVGKVTGNPMWMRQFAKAESRLMATGKYITATPVDYPDGLTQRDYMMLSVSNVFIADLLVRLPNWQDSPGAKAEVALAESIGTPVYDADEEILYE